LLSIFVLQAHGDQDDRPVEGNNFRFSKNSNDDPFGSSTQPPKHVKLSERPPNIIVVDDDAYIAKLFSLVLKQSGCNVSKTFSDGRELISYLSRLDPSKERALWPDIVILDYRMPQLDGVETAKILRANYPKMKIIMVSAYEPSNATKGYFDTYLTKPVPMSALIDAVSAVLGS